MVPGIVRAVLSTPGRPLDSTARMAMESWFGRDFSAVGVHTDSRAAESAAAVDAAAYTVGNQIVFGSGRYAPQSPAGRRLLAHELMHTVQQGESRAAGTGPLTIASADSAAEAEADRAADRIAARAMLSDGMPTVRAPSPGHAGSSPSRLQRQTRAEAESRQAPCERACEALESMRRSVDGICRLADENSEDCKSARARLRQNRQRVVDAGCKCATLVERQPVAPCRITYTKAAGFKPLIDLVRAAEARLGAAGITSVKEQIHALRGIYYGTTWSKDYAAEKSTTRNEGFQRFTRPSAAPATTVPRDVRGILDCGLFGALKDSQDAVDPSGRHVDFGHLIIALDARYDTAFAGNVQYPVAMPLGGHIDIDLGGTGTELVTWLGDLGGGAASLAVMRVSTPATSASAVFRGSDYGGSINLEGDIAGSVVATSSPSAVTAPAFAAGKGLADSLQDYLSPASPSASWNRRATTFLTMNGGTFDARGALTNRAALISAFAAKIGEFACNYLASRVGDKKVSLADAKAAAAKHVVSSSEEVATAFVDALIDSHKSGGRIEASRFPSPSAGGKSSCSMQLLAARFVGP
ncbi:MAG: DUF4157 domain-containing protein [Xanthomonadaceae bacterium]|nr:DUF4157 domain-containing protein [Xanthomonadaceae bacterium]